MIKKVFLTLLIPVLGLSSCAFFRINHDIPDINTDSKQALNYNIKDLIDNNYYRKSAIPSTGEVNFLVIPVWLSDSSSWYSYSQQQDYKNTLYKSYFGTEAQTGWHSVKSYYEKESHGKITINGYVTDFYTSTYSSNDLSNASLTETIAKDAIDKWKTANPGLVKSYDSDSDGYLDSVSLIYFAPDYQTFPSSDPRSKNNGLWAFCNWIQDSSRKNPANPGLNAYMWASYGFQSKNISFFDTIKIDTHTFIHEVGHLFGLQDYYDYNSSNYYYYAGGFSMQDMNVGGHDPYSVMALGWTDPYVVTETKENFIINDFQSSGDVALITPSFSNSPFDEYFLLELYTPTDLNYYDTYNTYMGAYPSGVRNYGIRLWHVDSRLLYTFGISFNKSDVTNVINNKDASYLEAMTNNTDGDQMDLQRLSPIKEYRKYHLLDLIRKGDMSGNRRKSYLSNNGLFEENDIFSMNQYSSYFANNGKLNSGVNFSFSFKVNAIDYNNKKASIDITIN